LVFPPRGIAIAERLSETFFGYPSSPLNSGSAKGLRGAVPGDRILDEKPFGAGDAPRFVLMAKDEAAAKLLVDRYPSLLENAIRTPPDAEGIWLVRPRRIHSRRHSWRGLENHRGIAGSDRAKKKLGGE
jgi:hypothetical protein